MSIPQLVVLIGVAVLTVVAMSVALAAAWLAGRRRAEASLDLPLAGATDASGGMAGLARMGSPRGSSAADATLTTISPVTVDRVVRVVALLFMAAVGVVVAASRAYPDTEVAIFLLLAAGTLFVVSMQDLLPASIGDHGRHWIGAAGALAFLTILVGLSGGLASPFFLGYFLLVVGASLATEDVASLAVVLAAGASYAIIGLLVAPGAATDSASLAWIGFDIAALALLSYVATVTGREQRRAREAALRLSRFDPLTGLNNRSAFFAAVEREIRRVERSGRAFCVLMLDLDDLKPVNDTFGHPAGDLLLRAITEVVLRTVRATDTAGRYGGDEFMVLLPETDPDGAFVVAEKLRRDIAALALRVDQRSVRTSVSVGLVAYPEDGSSIEDLLSAVDAAMYEAKRRGKNQIVGYTTHTERIATAMGADRAAALRPRPPREVEPRAVAVGVPSRGATSDRGTGPDGAASGATDAERTRHPRAGAVDPGGASDEQDEHRAPDDPDDPTDGPGSGPQPGARLSAAERQPVGFSVGRPDDAEATVRTTGGSAVDPTAPGTLGQDAHGQVTPGQEPLGAETAWPRIRSMPSTSLRALDAPVTIDAARAARLRPTRPTTTGGARPPVPPIGSEPWQTRPGLAGSGALPPRDPHEPEGRRYVAFPIQSDETPA